jgi:hypothetical protein
MSATLLTKRCLRGAGTTTLYSDRIDALLALERAMRNREGGYWIAADDPRAALHALTGEYDLADPSAAPVRIALVSDGVTRAVTRLPALRQLARADREPHPARHRGDDQPHPRRRAGRS